MLGAIGGDVTGHEIGLDRLGTGDGDMAAPEAGEVGHLAAHPVKVGDLGADVLDQKFAGRVEAHAARQALEDRRAEFLLEPLDPPVERRRGDVHVFRRLADRTGFCHRLDQGQSRQVLHIARQFVECCIFGSRLLQK